MVLARDYNRKRGQFAFLKHIVSSEKLPKVNNTVIITLDKLGRFYIYISVPLEDRENQTSCNGRIVSIDPGVRTFATCYDPRGRVVEWGSGDFGRIFRLCKQCDKFKSDLATKKGGRYKRTRYFLRKNMYRILLKIRNLTKEIHHKLAKWLLDHYETILLPEFRTSNMVKRKNRKIRSKTARAMLTWGEEYTSKTCGNCGFINNIKGAKRFSCSSCKISIDRDFNGARNILLKYLSESDILLGI
ncbi:3226_t:CDS:2 [Gigaspora margarita]|uniref:3226_t:CDS:1 n=1 Tax=Gigaspora margarita TaxID=4874 RepID=A0ABN7W401_GIGMA|nr:3226_t:CDS:2 [Gigaspora margarita]